jgi:DNA-binding transcriptional LysR family regulator
VTSIQPLQLFVAVAEVEHIARAGDRVGYNTHAAATMALRRLEEEVGARLVERGPGRGPAALTEAGEAFLPYARKAINSYHNGLLRLWQYTQEGKFTEEVPSDDLS